MCVVFLVCRKAGAKVDMTCVVFLVCRKAGAKVD